MRETSEKYRLDFRKQLLATRKKDRVAARELLAEKKETHLYKLAKLLHRTKNQEKEIFDQREYDRDIGVKDLNIINYSKEPNLFETFEYISNVSGAGVGVGIDQMLDVAVNTHLDEVYITDITLLNLFTTRALLEAGRRYHELYGRYPTPQEFLSFFEEGNSEMTLEMIRPEFDKREEKIIRTSLTIPFARGNKSSAIHRYLSYKATQPYYQSWISNQENLTKVIQMYETGKIKVVEADLAGKKSLPAIGNELARRGVPVSLLYLSNTIEFFLLEEARPRFFRRMKALEDFFENIAFLPVTDNTIVINVEAFSSKSIVPEQAANDPYLVQVPWSYVVQSMRDYGDFIDFASARAVDPLELLEDRLDDSLQRKDGVVRLPKPGIYLVDLPGVPTKKSVDESAKLE